MLRSIFQRFGPMYRSQFADRMLPSHLRTMQDIENCQTPAMGGQVFRCEVCDKQVFVYHSCKNRHCPHCMQDRIDPWLEKQYDLLLPIPYFLVTFTLPQELRSVARSNQKTVYPMIFRCAFDSLQNLAGDSRFMGGMIGAVCFLHTWTRPLGFHPHVHMLVPAISIGPDNWSWKFPKSDFLVAVKALSPIFRAKIRDAFKKEGLSDQVPYPVWSKNWVIHSEHVYSGIHALKYMAPYLFRGPVSNRNILSFDEEKVTFRYKDAKTGVFKTCSLPPMDFIHRILTHVLPKGFVRVRYYGILAAPNREKFKNLQLKLNALFFLLYRFLPFMLIPEKIVDRKGVTCPDCSEPLVATGLFLAKCRDPPVL